LWAADGWQGMMKPAGPPVRRRNIVSSGFEAILASTSSIVRKLVWVKRTHPGTPLRSRRIKPHTLSKDKCSGHKKNDQ
jgi:hypothetical protein